MSPPEDLAGVNVKKFSRAALAGPRGGCTPPGPSLFVYDLDTILSVSRSSTTIGWMRVELDDLLNAREVATVLGLAHREAVATYRRRYVDFPAPVLTKGTCVLWHRPDVEVWARDRGRA